MVSKISVSNAARLVVVKFRSDSSLRVSLVYDRRCCDDLRKKWP